jgi:hypothetical protein
MTAPKQALKSLTFTVLPKRETRAVHIVQNAAGAEPLPSFERASTAHDR